MKKLLEIDKELYDSLRKVPGGKYATEIDFTLKVAVTKVTFKTRKEALTASNTKSRKRRRSKKGKEFHDLYHKDALLLSKRFAKSFLRQEEYPNILSKPRILNKFKLASKKVAELAESLNVERRKVRTWLLEVVEEGYKNRDTKVSAGHLLSDYTWDILLPQHIEEVAPQYAMEDE